MIEVLATSGLAALGAGVAAYQLRQRGLTRWLPGYLAQHRRWAVPAAGQPVHALICIGDHYEPKLGKPMASVASARVKRWVEEYPRQLGGFRDSDGRPPRHSFFYPEEEYEVGYLNDITDLCREGYGEVEIHLHHHNDTVANLRQTLLRFRNLLAERHGQLAVHKATGEIGYGFIHGNWALCNSRPDGCWCGVNNELTVLRETGCYADFTLPSAPSPTQTSTINSIYYASDRPDRPRSHDRGVQVGRTAQPDGSLMLIQGPLVLDWGRRKWGLVPRIENACIQRGQAPTGRRLDLWLRARVQVPSRPDWYFVKLHTHGAPEWNADVLLGEQGVRFHEELARRAAADPNFQYHYVTAREMYNLARAAEAGYQGTVRGALDYELVWNGATPRSPVDIDSARCVPSCAEAGAGSP